MNVLTLTIAYYRVSLDWFMNFSMNCNIKVATAVFTEPAPPIVMVLLFSKHSWSQVNLDEQFRLY